MRRFSSTGSIPFLFSVIRIGQCHPRMPRAQQCCMHVVRLQSTAKTAPFVTRPAPLPVAPPAQPAPAPRAPPPRPTPWPLPRHRPADHPPSPPAHRPAHRRPGLLPRRLSGPRGRHLPTAPTTRSRTTGSPRDDPESKWTAESAPRQCQSQCAWMARPPHRHLPHAHAAPRSGVTSEHSPPNDHLGSHSGHPTHRCRHFDHDQRTTERWE